MDAPFYHLYDDFHPRLWYCFIHFRRVWSGSVSTPSRCGSSPSRCGSSTTRCGSSTSRCGSSTTRCGSSTTRCSSSTTRCTGVRLGDGGRLVERVVREHAWGCWFVRIVVRERIGVILAAGHQRIPVWTQLTDGSNVQVIDVVAHHRWVKWFARIVGVEPGKIEGYTFSVFIGFLIGFAVVFTIGDVVFIHIEITRFKTVIQIYIVGEWGIAHLTIVANVFLGGNACTHQHVGSVALAITRLCFVCVELMQSGKNVLTC